MRETDIYTASLGRQANLYKRLAALLAEATAALGRDNGTAGACIEHAVKLLPGVARQDAEQEARKIETGGLASWQKARLERHVAANLSERLLTSDLASLAQLSTGHFARAFKASLGVSPRAYINEQRIAAAKAMMLSTDMALSEIALASGLTDQAHFCRAFKRSVGSTPAAWRRRHREGLATASHACSQGSILSLGA